MPNTDPDEAAPGDAAYTTPPGRAGADIAPSLLDTLIRQCARVPYRHQYALVLREHPDPGRVLCELFLFRLWLAWATFGHAHPHHPASGSHGSAAPADRTSEARTAFESHYRVDACAQLDAANWEALVRDRFALYARHFASRATQPAPVNFYLVSIALSHRLSDAPSPVLTAQLALIATRVHSELRRACANG